MPTENPTGRAGPGRHLPGSPGFADDDGRADPRLVTALRRDPADPAYLPLLLAALHEARVLGAVLAGAASAGAIGGNPVGGAAAEISVPVLGCADGARGLPVFSDLGALARWEPAARPVPVTGPHAAQVALAEGAEALVLDVAGPVAAELAAPELQALAEGRGRRPAWTDPVLAEALVELLEGEPAAGTAHLEPCLGRDARLTVILVAGCAADPASVLARLAREVAALPVVAAGVRGVEVAVVVPGEGRQSGSRRPEVQGPEVQGPEVQGPEVQGPEVQGLEVQGVERCSPDSQGRCPGGPRLASAAAGC